MEQVRVFRVIRVSFARGDTAFDSGFRQSLRLNSELLIRQAAVFADDGSRPQSEKQQAHGEHNEYGDHGDAALRRGATAQWCDKRP